MRELRVSELRVAELLLEDEKSSGAKKIERKNKRIIASQREYA